MILRNPDYKMEDKLLLHKVDVARQTVEIDGREYDIKEETFPTVNPMKIWRMYTNSPKSEGAE